MTDLSPLWEELAATSQGKQGKNVRRIPNSGVLGVRLFVSHPSGSWGMEIEAAPGNVPLDFRVKSTAGYLADISTEQWETGKRTVVSLESASHYLNVIFSQMVEDVLTISSEKTDQKSALLAFSTRLDAWNNFFKNRGEKGLSKEQQQALFAELKSLEQFFLPAMSVPSALASWTGPLSRPHDFKTSVASLEVKSSVGPQLGHVIISNARQLDLGPSQLPLFLTVWHLDIASTQGQSLGAIVTSLEQTLRQSSEGDWQRFRDLVLSYGWNVDDRFKYGDSEYAIRSVSAFRVTEAFPKLVESSLPVGIEDVSYRLSLAACESFRIDVRELSGVITKDARS